MSALPKAVTAAASEAVIHLRAANRHELELLMAGRIGRVFSREQVADLAGTLESVRPTDGCRLIAAFLPGFSREEYAAFVRAVREFERLAAAEAERENPRHWPSTVRVTL